MRPTRHFRLRIGVQCVVAGGLLVAGVGLHPSVGIAQVATTITSSGLGTQVNQVGTVHNITGGTRPGGGLNLFHSFGFFSVGAGDTGNFSNNTGLATRNILGRVTGGEVSNVFGRIQTEGFGAANLFLINPAGWIFGSTASLNVGGSFHVSTADYLRFPDVNGAQVRFLADASPLPANGLGVDPIAFGFLNPNPTRIAITGSRLQVPTGQTLSIVGGEAPFAGEVETGLKVTGPSTAATPTLLAPGGRIQLVSVASPGEVTLNPDVSSFSRLGRIDLSNGARIDVSGVNGPGGTVVIRGGQFFATQASRIIANTTGSANGAATAVDAQVTGEMSLAGGSTIDVRTSGAGASGETRITAASLEVREGSLIQSTTSNGGAGGDISVDVETATFRSGGTISTLSDRVVRPPPQVTTNGGPGGDVTLTATGAVLIDGANSGLTSTTLSQLAGGAGTGGRLSVSAASLTLDNAGRMRTTSSGTGAAGPMVLDVGEFTLANGGNLRSRTINAPGGSVTVTATGSATIAGTDSAGNPSGVFSGSSGTGSVGPISVSAGRLTLTGGLIQSGTSLDPGGGNVTATATDSITVSDGGGISSQARSQDVGEVTVSAPSVTIDNGFLSTSTIGLGDAGPLNVGTAAQPMRTLTLLRGGQISSSSELTASGAGGTVTVNASDSVSISGRIPSGFALAPSDVRQRNPDPHSGIFSTASGSGAGGNILVRAGQRFEITDRGIISANSTGTDTALAGNVTIQAGSKFLMQNSRITTESLLADGGNISIATTGSLFHLKNSQITTSVQSGVGQGGNITIDSQLIVLDASRINADAFGGPGGNIDVTAQVYLAPNSLVTASSALSTPGEINIQANITDVSGTLARLPEAILQAAGLLPASCAARLAGGKSSSLVLAGREGVPLEPGGLLPSPLIGEGPADALRLSSEEQPWWETFLRVPRLALDARCSR